MSFAFHPARRVLASATLALLCAAPFAAQAITIDFAALPADAFTAVNPVLGGLLFSNPQQYVMAAAFGPPAQGQNILGSFVTNVPGDERFLSIRSADGQAFALTSFVAAENTCCSEDHVLIVSGQFADGSQSTKVFTNLSKTAWQTETLNWTGLSSVQLKSELAYGGYADFLSFNTTPVPEPATAALLMAGLGLFGGARLRRTSAACRSPRSTLT